MSKNASLLVKRGRRAKYKAVNRPTKKCNMWWWFTLRVTDLMP